MRFCEIFTEPECISDVVLIKMKDKKDILHACWIKDSSRNIHHNIFLFHI